jgi:spermidine synthase
MDRSERWFLPGLFLCTLATVADELLDTRFLSVVAWYHLSFFAVSLAMFGMSAGAVRVYLGGAKFEGESARGAIARLSALFAFSIPVSHVASLCVPFTVDLSLTSLASLVVLTGLISAPFYLSGMLVTIALTRIPGRIALTYAVDLIGASLGSILVIPLLRYSNISSAFFAVAAFAAAGAACFQRFAGVPSRKRVTVFALAMAVLAVANSGTLHGFRVQYAKGQLLTTELILHEGWNIHSLVIVDKPTQGAPPYWGVSEKTPLRLMSVAKMKIDGAAGTGMAEWDGSAEDADWVRADVTSLPYHLRRGGDAAVIGVGGGRDILTALWGESRSVVGIEINSVFIDMLTGPLRAFSRIADHPGVSLVHDEARSYLTGLGGRFDTVQMSLIDTWAATGAGAFTLSENGLYTREAWKVFLDALKPGGIFSVSRWFSPTKQSETTRLLVLGVAALIDRGVHDPAEHIALVSCGSVATLLVSTAALTPEDLTRIQRAAQTYDFHVLLAPGQAATDPLLARVTRSTTLDELREAIVDERYDYSPPTDDRPYFFNILRPSGVLEVTELLRHRTSNQGSGKGHGGVVATGNLVATATLLALGVISMGLVAIIVAGPLWRSGLPSMNRASFAHGVSYFASIGAGYMMIQISSMQTYSVYLGHPTYAVAVVLFSMILFTGIGSFLSQRIPVETGRVGISVLPLAIAGCLLAAFVATHWVVAHTIDRDLPQRCAIAVAMTAPLSILLGCCFPVGMRLMDPISKDAMPWMWGSQRRRWRLRVGRRRGRVHVERHLHEPAHRADLVRVSDGVGCRAVEARASAVACSRNEWVALHFSFAAGRQSIAS